MDYEPYDSSGTDDDLPPQHQNRMPRGGRISRNGRPPAMGSQMPCSRMYDNADMEVKLHQLEQEAYISVLRAFKAQDDSLTWDKESLITELRKELKLSNEEHRDLLSRVNADESIRRIREWKQSLAQNLGIHVASQAAHDVAPSPSVSASRKKQKITQSLPSQSFGGPSPFHPHTMTQGQANQLSSSAAKRGTMMGVKGKKHKSIPSGSSSLKMQHPPGPAGRGQFGNNNRISSAGLMNNPAEKGSLNALIGRKVMTRWPDDNNFYEALITDYNQLEGLHALVYDMGTQSETWEWVNLSEMSPDDIKWDGEDPGVYRHGGPRSGMGRPRDNNNNPPGSGGGRGLTKSQPRKDFPHSQNGMRKGPDDIRLLHTDTVIKEVGRIFGSSHPDPVEVEKAKKVLKEHEQALADAIARLADLSDGDSGGGGRFLHEQVLDRK